MLRAMFGTQLLIHRIYINKSSLYLYDLPFIETINWYNSRMMKFNDIFVESNENLELNFTVNNYIYGKSYTYFNPDKRINGKWGEGNSQLSFHLQPDIPIYLFIHDPNFFLGTDHPSIFPGYFKKIEVKSIFGINLNNFQTKLQKTEPTIEERYFISVTEHQLLYRSERPCEVELTLCFKSSL